MKKTAEKRLSNSVSSVLKLLILTALFCVGSNDAVSAFPWNKSKQQGKPVSPGVLSTGSTKESKDKKNNSRSVSSSPQMANGSEQVMVTSSELSVLALRSLAGNSNDLPNLRMVSGRLLRGGQPSDSGLQLLKQAGVKTVIDLRAEEPKLVEHERKAAERLGMKFIAIPMYTFDTPDNKQFQQFLTAVANADNGPVYVHCLHGRDRTGTMIGAYRIMFENWTFDNAFKEMMVCGFRPGLANLTRGLHDLAVSKGDKSPLPSASFVAADLKSRLQGFRNGTYPNRSVPSSP